MINMLKSFNEQLRKIKKEVERMAEDFAYDLAHQAEQEMRLAHKQIIDNFYKGHSTTSYHRRGGLYNSLIPQEVYSIKSKSYNASIVVGSFNMKDHYRKGATPDNVFDLMWNQGIRGLPKQGTEPLSKSFTFYGNHFEQGEIWVNPYWSGSDGPYHNLFTTTISIGKYKTKTPGTPADVMADFVEHWGMTNGIDACKRISNEIKNRFKST